MRWPWKRDKKDEPSVEVIRARQELERQKAVIAEQRDRVDEVVNSMRQIRRDNHLADKIRYSFRDLR